MSQSRYMVLGFNTLVALTFSPITTDHVIQACTQVGCGEVYALAACSNCQNDATCDCTGGTCTAWKTCTVEHRQWTEFAKTEVWECVDHCYETKDCRNPVMGLGCDPLTFPCFEGTTTIYGPATRKYIAVGEDCLM